MSSRGRIWFERFAGNAARVTDLPPSVLAADVELGGRAARVLAVVPDERGRFERARRGEVGIDEGFGLARAVDGAPAAILAIVDVPGQAFGIREEAAGLQRALAASVEAYASKRRAGTPVAALVVGKAISGAFLAHGMQVGWIGALRDPQVEVHVMSAPAVARVTLMAPEAIARLAGEIPATARDIEAFAGLGAIDELFTVRDAAAPADEEFAQVEARVALALASPAALRNPVDRLASPRSQSSRALSQKVREQIGAQWNA